MKKLLAACVCAGLSFSFAGCSPETILEQFTSTGDTSVRELTSSSDTTTETETKDRIYMDELSGTLQDFSGSQLILNTDSASYVFNVSNATLECKGGMITGDEISIIYEGQLSGTDTGSVHVLKVVDEFHKKNKLKKRTAHGQVISLTSNTITIKSKKGKTATYPITGTKQYYQATEYFRVRYAKDRMYLLNYERNMEAYMRYDTIDRSNNRILLGIGSSQKQLISKNGGKKAAFVVQDELWYYDYQKSNMHKVFSFEGEDYRDSRNNYQKHAIQIMKMKNNGDIAFLVYGYMNRGKHEGENGISVYQYTASDQKIEELGFIPTQIQYDMMENDIKKGAFLSGSGQFYFYLDGAVYQVDLDSGKSKILAKNITDDMTVISENGMLALNQSKNKMKVVDLSTQKTEVITCKDDQVLRPIGFIEKDFIYGVGNKKKL